ncbi:MAG: single-stranded-DNA-specific exonuclease RecJ [Alphaproteobacteria bacterium]|nr:single-stranded-DNA-specific exonuclease RecJ [Alphaproteobacteria bacterium]MDY4689773.1 single-stranded-DNA-specific exonuclease RecJ [Alphaproteobacteria bacterium]
MDSQQLSLGGNIWKSAAVDEGMAERMSLAYNLSPALAHLLCVRKIAFNEVNNFINPKLQNLMPDPYVLKDMQKAAERVAQAVENGEKIAIIGDYDVDGATSTSELVRFFKAVGINPQVHIPSREEGYGPSDLAFNEFEAAGAKLVITIDCGTTAFEVLNRAAAKGFEIIVIDHHEAEAKLPDIYAVVNPKRLDEDNQYPYLTYMSAVGVGFMFLVALNRKLRNDGFYGNHPAPELKNLLDLVALGTVCDVVPLLGLNRAYVRQGLKIMAQQNNIGLKSLLKAAQVESAPNAYHLGFVLGPRINACGRVGDAVLGSRLLCCENETEAQLLADKFNALNAERKDIENYVLLKAIEQVEGQTQEYPIAFAYGEDWHQGVIGIVAGKLKERYNVPAFVMSVEPDEVKGSARSIEGVDLGALIISAKEKGVITGGGGHIMAAGFSLTKEQIPAFKKFVGEYVEERLGKEKIAPVLNIDLALALSGVTEDFADSLAMLEPYGAGNPEPLVLIRNVSISHLRLVGSGHVSCFLSSPSGGSLKAIAFRCADNDIGNALLNNNGELFDAVGQIKTDVWQGRKTIQMIINDLRRVE